MYRNAPPSAPSESADESLSLRSHRSDSTSSLTQSPLQRSLSNPALPNATSSLVTMCINSPSSFYPQSPLVTSKPMMNHNTTTDVLQCKRSLPWLTQKSNLNISTGLQQQIVRFLGLPAFETLLKEASVSSISAFSIVTVVAYVLSRNIFINATSSTGNAALTSLSTPLSTSSPYTEAHQSPPKRIRTDGILEFNGGFPMGPNDIESPDENAFFVASSLSRNDFMTLKRKVGDIVGSSR